MTWFCLGIIVGATPLWLYARARLAERDDALRRIVAHRTPHCAAVGIKMAQIAEDVLGNG